ncbi:MAG: transporter substrate-binding domain-containing protein [Clostridia bacterium]|nr:transporter substrate-binding domain-containing protein [Clostridia bacterium]
MKKLIALLMTLLLIVACFAGCGAANTNSDDNGGAKKETIVVGYTIYSPMNYFDEDGKTLIGFDTDLAKAVFEGLGYDVMFQEIDWDSKYTDVNSGTIDCIWNGFTCNSKDDDGIERSKKVDFSYNYMENRQVVVVKKDSGIKKAADLKGKTGAAEAGSAGETYLKDFDGANYKGCPKQTDCLTEVNAMTADFAVLDAQLAKSYCGKGDYADLMIVEDLSSDVEYYAIGFKKGSELTAKVNEQLVKLAKDGTIKKIAEKYDVLNTTILDYADQVK